MDIFYESKSYLKIILHGIRSLTMIRICHDNVDQGNIIPARILKGFMFS